MELTIEKKLMALENDIQKFINENIKNNEEFKAYKALWIEALKDFYGKINYEA